MAKIYIQRKGLIYIVLCCKKADENTAKVNNRSCSVRLKLMDEVQKPIFTGKFSRFRGRILE